MGKKLNIPKIAVKFILDKRDDINTNYTFEDIKKLLKSEFNINISLQGVRYHYQQNKDNPIFDNLIAKNSKLMVTAPPIVQDNEKTEVPVAVRQVSEIAKQSTFDFLKHKSKKQEGSKGFDKKIGDDLSKDDIAKLLGKED